MSIGKSPIYPTTMWQQFLLSRLLDSSCSPSFDSAWVLAQACLVRPYVDLRRLKRAFTNLVKRHDVLRTRFVQEGGVWRAVIEKDSDIKIKVIELGDMDDHVFRRKIHALSCAPLSILSDVLSEVILAKCGARGDVIITRVHHAISDGYGMIVLAEDLVKLLIGMPILGSAVSHAEYITKWQSPKGQRKQDVDSFWERKLLNFPKAPMIGRKAKGLEPLVRTVGWTKTKALTVKLETQSIAALSKRAVGLNTTKTTMLFTGFLEALCKVYDQDRIAFASCPSRTEKGLDTFVGDHTLDPICIYIASETSSIEKLVKRTQTDLMDVISNLPADGARFGSAMDDKIIDYGGYPRQFRTYVARAKNRENNSPFRSGFNAKAGEVQHIGSFELSQIELHNGVFTVDELQIRVEDNGDEVFFLLGYDVDAYAPSEIEVLAREICNVLDLIPLSMVAA